ncbi:MAG: TetR/AcrR family transcriptional regulator [Sphaerochaetaceae bacterium]|nr:TetR/AcrR family transcriptional regulator [Sphaerochaetaceae bacterium]
MKDYTERQRQIIDTSLTLSSQGGMNTLTIRNIARDLGVTEPAIYRHFDSKHEILVAMLDVLQSTISPHFMLLNRKEVSTESFFIPFFTALFTTIEENPAFALFIFSEEVFHSDATLRPHLSELLEKILKNLETLCAGLQSSTHISDSLTASDIAFIILSTVRLTVTRWNVAQEKYSLVSQVEQLNRLLCTVLFNR